jgi:uncharacterized membrane protein
VTRSRWELRWFKLFMLALLYILAWVLAVLILGIHSYGASSQFVLRPSDTVLADFVGFGAVFGWFVVLPVAFWSGVVTGCLEFGYQRRKRVGEMFRYYLRDQSPRAGHGGGPSAL